MDLPSTSSGPEPHPAASDARIQELRALTNDWVESMKEKLRFHTSLGLISELGLRSPPEESKIEAI